MLTVTSLHKAREHGSLADQLYTVGDLNGAIKQHHLAADAYMECITFTQNRGVRSLLVPIADRELTLRIQVGKDPKSAPC